MTEPTKEQALQVAAAFKWSAAHNELHRAKIAEMDLRVKLVAAVFPGELSPGTFNHVFHDGSTLKMEVKPSVKVEPKLIAGALSKLAKRVDGVLLVLRLVKWMPVASIAELKKLSPSQRKLFDGIITVEPSAPSLKLVPSQ